MSTGVALPDRWLTDWPRSPRMPFYTRANAGEVLADPASPLGWTLVFEKGLLPGWLRGLVEFGIYREGELPTERPPVAGLFGGYFYINLSHCRVVAIRMGMTVEAFDAALLGSAAAAPPYQPHPDDPCDECSAKVAQTIGEILAASQFPQIDTDTERVLAKRRGRPDLAALSAADLVAHARSFLPELDNAFARHDDASRASFDVALASSARMIPLREQTKLIAVTTINEVRLAIRELGRRGVAAGYYAAPEDVMMLLESELDDYVADPARFAPVIAERLAQYLALSEIEPPFIIDADPAPLPGWPKRAWPRPEPAKAGEVLKGIGGSAGRCQGRARVGLDLPAAMALEPGEILVAPLTDAAWTPLFLVAGAVVVDVGALNSHAVVVSRELGIPCVLSLEDATARLRDGMELAVDGTAGTVTVMSDGQP